MASADEILLLLAVVVIVVFAGSPDGGSTRVWAWNKNTKHYFFFKFTLLFHLANSFHAI